MVRDGFPKNAKTISLRTRKLSIMQCVGNKGQEVFKSLSVSVCSTFLLQAD